jgi:hypothetical protein
MDVITATNTITATSDFFSGNMIAYAICISFIFLFAFMFVCWQLLNIFKGLLEKVIGDVLYEIRNIKQDLKDFKDELKEYVNR